MADVLKMLGEVFKEHPGTLLQVVGLVLLAGLVLASVGLYLVWKLAGRGKKVELQRKPFRIYVGPQDESVAGVKGKPVLSHLLTRISDRKDPDLLLYTLSGVAETPAQRPVLDTGSLYFLWADPDGSWIRAWLAGQAPARELRVRFHNAEAASYPPNVAVRPGGARALANPSTLDLGFEASLPPKVRADHLDTVALSFRVIDRNGTQWCWGKGADWHHIRSVGPGGWVPVRLKLSAPESEWHPFGADGNHRYATDAPDFSVVVAVVIEFGCERRNQRPGPGAGEIRFRGFDLVSD